VAALVVTWKLWTHIDRRVLSLGESDQTFFDWMLTHGARVVFDAQSPFFSDQLNAPNGVNLIANTSLLGLSVPLAPLTEVAGPNVSFAVLLILALAGTASAWYFVLSRHVVQNRLAAFVGAAFCGFAPGMVSHANGQPDIVAQFLVPFIVWRLVKLREPAHRVRNGVIVGLLVSWQALINEEILLFTLLATVVFGAAYLLVSRPGLWRPKPLLAGLWRELRAVLPGLAIGVAIAVGLLAYPLWVQFRGAQAFHGLPFDTSIQHVDVASFMEFARLALGSAGGAAHSYVTGPTEENAFFGWPLLCLLAVILIWSWRQSRLLRAASVTAVVFAAFSVGPQVTLRGRSTGVPGPFRLVEHLPLINLVTPGRLALVLIPMVGVILAVGCAAIQHAPAQDTTVRRLWRTMWGVAFVAALLPIAPFPLPTEHRAAVPAFLASGEWRSYVPAGRTVVPVPLPTQHNPTSMYWSASQGEDFAIPGGYFLGPKSATNDKSIIGAPARPTAILLGKVARTGKVPTIGPAAQAATRADLHFWRAAVLVLPPGDNEEVLWKAVTNLLGFVPRWIDGLWVWDVKQV
jgi:hypothetical protein